MWQMKPEIHLWRYIISAAVDHTALALVLLMGVVKAAAAVENHLSLPQLTMDLECQGNTTTTGTDLSTYGCTYPQTHDCI